MPATLPATFPSFYYYYISRYIVNPVCRKKRKIPGLSLFSTAHTRKREETSPRGLDGEVSQLLSDAAVKTHRYWSKVHFHWRVLGAGGSSVSVLAYGEGVAHSAGSPLLVKWPERRAPIGAELLSESTWTIRTCSALAPVQLIPVIVQKRGVRGRRFIPGRREGRKQNGRICEGNFIVSFDTNRNISHFVLTIVSCEWSGFSQEYASLVASDQCVSLPFPLVLEVCIVQWHSDQRGGERRGAAGAWRGGARRSTASRVVASVESITSRRRALDTCIVLCVVCTVCQCVQPVDNHHVLTYNVPYCHHECRRRRRGSPTSGMYHFRPLPYRTLRCLNYEWMIFQTQCNMLQCICGAYCIRRIMPIRSLTPIITAVIICPSTLKQRIQNK